VECLADALARLERESFDVLLLDLSLPDSTGSDTFRHARQTATNIPIVVLTGAEDENLSLDAIRHDVEDYLVKGSANGPQIVRAIRYAIERKQMKKELNLLNAVLEERIRQRTLELTLANEAMQRELTERVRAEAKHLIYEMEERTRQAREINNIIAHDLASVLILLESAEFNLDDDIEAVRTGILKAQRLTRESLREVRRTAAALRPQVTE
jgi:DNA-binding response OmpR family regulator